MPTYPQLLQVGISPQGKPLQITEAFLQAAQTSAFLCAKNAKVAMLIFLVIGKSSKKHQKD